MNDNHQHDTHVIYLHGFASGPSSTKAQYFETKLKEVGFSVVVPDLNLPSFNTMTLSSQLKIVNDCIEASQSTQKLILVGSSMGGLLATLRSSEQLAALNGLSERLKALILLAPGFGLPRRWTTMLGDEGLKRWSETGEMEVFHYGINANALLSYDFISDAMQYVTEGLQVSVPTLVFHGDNDETVPVQESKDFARMNPETVALHVLADNHDLLSSLDQIWLTTNNFLRSNGLIANQ